MARINNDDQTADLFGSLHWIENPAPPKPARPQIPALLLPPKKLRRRSDERTWHLVDHCCRHCMGRVLERRSRGKVLEARCAECGERAEGDHTEICCCGAEAGAVGTVLECVRNPEVSKSVPQEVLVRERKIRATPPEKERQRRPVVVKDY